MTLLTIIQNVAAEVNISSPSEVIGNSDPNIAKLLVMANKSGRMIAKRHDWQGLLVMHTWSSAASQEQSDGPPSQADFDRFEYNVDLWNRSLTVKYAGPTGPNGWNTLLASTSAGAGFSGYWRLIRGVLNIYPAPSASQTLAMPYLSSYWVNDGADGLAAFSDDDETTFIPDHLIELDLVWRWKHSNGLDYAEDMSDFERQLELAASRDKGLRAIMPISRTSDSMPPVPFWDGQVTV